jgi:hypothetical protein
MANDSRQEPHLRRAAVFELFRNLQTEVPLSLGRVGEALDGPTWLADREIAVIDSVGGKLPVKWSSNDTIVAISVFPRLSDDGSVWTAYMRIEGHHRRSEIADCLRKPGRKRAAATALVIELALSPAI